MIIDPLRKDFRASNGASRGAGPSKTHVPNLDAFAGSPRVVREERS